MREFWMKIKCFLSIIIYMAVVKPKRVGMLMQTAKDTLIAGINRQAHSVTYTDRLAYCETETDRAFTLVTDTQTHRDRQARSHTLFCDACWLNQCRNILPGCSDACYTVRSNLTVTLHSRKYSMTVNSMFNK